MFRRLLPLLAALALLAALPRPAAAQAKPGAFTPEQRREIVEILRKALREDPSILRDAITALQADENARESAAASSAIRANAAALTATPGDPVAGNPQGDVTVVEFYDVRCPYCRRMLPVMADLIRQDPKLRIVYKDIPILGPGSVVGAKATLAADRQGAYLRMREALMTGPAQIDLATVKAAAGKLGLDWDRLQRDMADPAIEARIQANLRLANALGISGTPAFIIGDRLIPGAVSLADLQRSIAETRGR